jgi:DNA (cytosine-5)-methyltransferase 1
MMKMKLRLLDLFCGAGGAGMGYHRAGFEVVGVDIKPQPHYPFEFIKMDAFEYLVNHGREYDAIHASPPCQAYSKAGTHHRWKHPDLIAKVRNVLMAKDRPFVIENVEQARFKLRSPIMLCGSMFGLKIQRHRYFETEPEIYDFLPPCNHSRTSIYIPGTPRPKNGKRKDPSASIKREALETPWMTIEEMDEAIPPAYTEWIGKQLIKRISEKGDEHGSTRCNIEAGRGRLEALR